ncbi:hypothetical protein H5410_035651 [Solanum commersonii]|uniref:Reverse transcriptase n=1 Tax=Solanum commersonii TaxID=4109 RepID=A0A9J5Y1A2_SOLCO|nr:hypothetical protein H5410_035651 [Solanum commersonii]
MNIVKETWCKKIQVNLVQRVQNKLKNLSKALSKWSRETIGDVFEVVKKMEDHNILIEEQYEMDDSNHNRILLHKAQVEYIKWLKLHEYILRQKARVKWAEERDTNSKYFYSNLFTRNDDTRDTNNNLINHLNRLVIKDDNELLEAIPTEDEVRNAIYSMDPNSCAGPDGYNGLFFQSTWDIIKYDMLDYSQSE